MEHGIHEDHLKALDVSKLIPQIVTYLNVPINLKLQRHRLDEYGGRWCALVYIGDA